MKIWNRSHGYIFNKYRDTVKCVLECVDELPIVREMALLATISEAYKCEIRRGFFVIDVTFGNEYFETRNFMCSTATYHRIPCENVHAYVHTCINRYSTTPIFAQICILDSEDTWLVFSLVKKWSRHSFCKDGWRLEEL